MIPEGYIYVQSELPLEAKQGDFWISSVSKKAYQLIKTSDEILPLYWEPMSTQELNRTLFNLESPDERYLQELAVETQQQLATWS